MKAHARKALMSSECHTWRTPKWFFAAVERLFVDRYGGPFDLDAAASANNHLCPAYYTEEQDALRQPWAGRVWVNPPYGAMIKPFLLKAYRSSLEGAIVAALIPARPDTQAWHEVAQLAAEIRLIKGRISFLDDAGAAADPATFPSALLIFDKSACDRRVYFWDPKDSNLSFPFMIWGGAGE